MLYVFLTIIILLLLASAYFFRRKKEAGSSGKFDTREANMFGTSFYLKAYGRTPGKALDKALKRLAGLEEKFSVFKESSEISFINKNSGGTPKKVSKDLFLITEHSYKYSQLTDGLFDPTVEPLVKLWGIGKESFRIPEENEISEVQQLVNYNDIELDSRVRTVRLKKAGQSLSFGAIAKGYAADIVKDILLKAKVKSAFIDLGGNIYVIGSRPDGSPWRIGIQDPLRRRGAHMGILSLKAKSIVTSGSYERFSFKDGKFYHHILDTRTGYPSESGLLSTTIVSDKSIDGDALTTAIFVMGLEKGLKFVESQNGLDAIFITQDNDVCVTSGIRENFTLTSNEFHLL